MPGLVIDPHQNPEEKDFGIVFSTERNKCYRYRKEAEKETRFYLFGEVVDIELPGEDEEERIEEGCYITHGWVTIKGYLANQDLSPVYKRVIRTIPEAQRRKAIRDAMSEGMPSPFPPPK